MFCQFSKPPGEKCGLVINISQCQLIHYSTSLCICSKPVLLDASDRNIPTRRHHQLLDQFDLLLQVAFVITDQAHSNHRTLPFIQIACLRNRSIQASPQPVDQTLDRGPFLLQRPRLRDVAIDHEQQDMDRLLQDYKLITSSPILPFCSSVAELVITAVLANSGCR